MSFSEFVEQFNKTYADESERAEHERIFNENMDKIDAANKKNNGFTMGVTEFTDISEEEFNRRYMTLGSPSNESVPEHVSDPTRASLPQRVDWRDFSAVTVVKNQNPCGTCWSFAGAGAIEGIVAIRTRSLVSLSNQEFQDCTGGGHSCSGQDAGGFYDAAFRYARDYGVSSNSYYPFNPSIGQSHQSCRAYPKQVAAGAITGYRVVASSENALMDALYHQPVAVALNAQYGGPIQHYRGGIITEYCSTALDHAVLAIGYGTEYGTNYWLIKNSWGANWGESGYFRLVRGQNKCGVLKAAYYPTM